MIFIDDNEYDYDSHKDKETYLHVIIVITVVIVIVVCLLLFVVVVTVVVVQSSESVTLKTDCCTLLSPYLHLHLKNDQLLTHRFSCPFPFSTCPVTS